MAQSRHDATYYLQRYWGHSQFRPQQAEIIASVMTGHDTVALLPTGGGKSICYQLPAIAMEGICIVVSPLIALMKDQVEQLKQRGIKAACLTSGMNSIEQSIVLNNSLYGNMKLLYVSPERLRNKTFLGHLRQMKVSLIAVDEAHCISQWGHDFRPTYLDIADIRKYHPHTPVLALTATATPQVTAEIAERLQMRQPQFFQRSFQRDNLSYQVIEENDKIGRLMRLLRDGSGSAIVYVRNRRRCREVALALGANGITATYYHAGLNAKERDQRQTQWMNGTYAVMVATNAFGMGIDKPDVRIVAHLDLPNSIEAYFQEAGRAGRDGKPSQAVVLYNSGDIAALRHAHEEAYPSLLKIRSIYNAVCNYYQVPIGSGQDSSFDLDLEAICNTYQMSPTTVYAALQHLERMGLVALPSQQEPVSRLYIPLDRETLYRFQMGQPRYAPLIDTLLRTYGGVMTNYVGISERLLAKRCGSDAATVEKMLLHLDALKIVTYRRHSDKPQICLPTFRVDDSVIGDSDATYRKLEAAAQQRMEAIIAYVGNRQRCRSEQLVAYFGERQEQPCGRCDNCLQSQSTDSVSLQEALCSLLRQQPLRLEELVERISRQQPAIGQQAVEAAIRRLLDERRIGMDGELRLYA